MHFCRHSSDICVAMIGTLQFYYRAECACCAFLPTLFLCFQYLCQLYCFRRHNRRLYIGMYIHWENQFIDTCFGLEGIIFCLLGLPSREINWRLRVVFKWLVYIFMEVFKDYFLAFMSFNCITSLTFLHLNWIWNHTQVLFWTLKIHTQLLFYKALKPKKKIVPNTTLNKITCLVLSSTSSVSLGKPFCLSRLGFLICQGGIVLRMACYLS